ncbi:GNAT family N-acetyltransferase [Microbulbifer sp. SAOS-129_SWC]|uniref:GNAT family N-acetyltransferase n=1 Tax=Microbulbifer sp. SAOS-129_SWC TaxID=3145235 RepID=UPI0032165D6D
MAEPNLQLFTEAQLPELMSWIGSRVQGQQWGGPTFRYPFDAETFAEDTRWRELPSFALQGAGGQLLAFGQYYERLQRCHLGRLIVAPEQRGRGWGSALITQLVARGCAELGVSECSLFVLKDNAPARALYRRLGFEYADYPERYDWTHLIDYMVAPRDIATGRDCSPH